MSNCIRILKGEEVCFFPDEIDIEGFKALMAKAKNHSSTDGTEWTREKGEQTMAWWFLSNSAADHRGVAIWFGCGRSSHTWRDFQGTLSVLKQFIKKPKTHRFTCSDESDGFEHPFKMKVEFQTGKISD